MGETTTARRVSMRDIAHRVGVSQPTVSRALRDDPRITPAVRLKVQGTAREMGYQPDPMLSALASYRREKSNIQVASALAWFNSWTPAAHLYRHREFVAYLRGARAEAARFGYRLEEFLCGPGCSLPRLQKILATRNIRGILIPPIRTSDRNNWPGFDWERFCVVRFGHSITTPRAHLVTSDQLTDGLIAFNAMRERGYRRIGLVTSSRAQTRFTAGYLYAQLSMPPAQRLPLLSLDEDDPAHLQGILSAWMKRNAPDAVLTDVSRLRELLQRAGYRIPQDVGLAALSVLDGNADAGIDQNSEDIGRAAVRLLTTLINSNELGVPAICHELLVEGKWVDGSTLPRRV